MKTALALALSLAGFVLMGSTSELSFALAAPLYTAGAILLLIGAGLSQ